MYFPSSRASAGTANRNHLSVVSVTTRLNSRKPCLVEGCLEMIAPSMWKAHMTLHAQNILPGDILLEWLQEQDSFICLQCHQIVANSRFGSHSEKCSGSSRGPRSSGVSVASTTTAPGQGTSEGSAPEASLPSFEAVCHLQCATFLKKIDPHLLGFCQIHCVQYVFPTQKKLG